LSLPATRPIRRLARGRKLSITVISDLHAGGPDMTLAHIRQVVDTANALKSDLVVLLGDYIASYRFVSKRVPNGVWAAELARLTAPLGTWAILGNHDWWHDPCRHPSGARGGAAFRCWKTMRCCSGRGSAVLACRPRRSAAYRLGYMAAFAASTICRGRSRRSETDDPVVLLAHEPDIFPRVPARVALTLAGHTHGGQIRYR
jgi:predicted MPP superfamily phosphohydrolase